MAFDGVENAFVEKRVRVSGKSVRRKIRAAKQERWENQKG
jgi:hypothetical protein